MRKMEFSLMMAICVCPMIALAQMNGSAPDTSPHTPEWQLTLDVIKVKSATLVDKNNQLVAQRDAMEAQYAQLETSTREWQAKNDELRRFLKERHGRSDEQIHVEELTAQVKLKEVQAKEIHKQLADLQKEVSSMEQKIQLKKLKMTDLQLQRNEEAMQANIQKAMEDRAAIENNEELSKIKETLDQEKSKEADLEKQLETLKQSQPKEPLVVPVDEAQIKLLEEKLETLRQQKDDLQKRLNGDNNQPGLKRYEQLMLKKKDLEATIKGFETQLSQLKDPSTLAFLRNPRRKETLHQMIEVDTKNTKLRQKIASLREDLVLLREQVRRLERKLKAGNST